MERIEAVNFALDNDDGARTHYYDKADLILVGVSRCGKTPTCLYMAMQFGIRAANYPLTEDDMEHLTLPAALRAPFPQAVRPDHRPGPTHRHPQRAQARTAAIQAMPSASLKCAKWKICSVARILRTSIPRISGGRDFREDSGGERRGAQVQITVRGGLLSMATCQLTD